MNSPLASSAEMWFGVALNWKREGREFMSSVGGRGDRRF